MESTAETPSATPYDRARVLADQGLSSKDIRAKLIADGIDAETASVAASAVAGKAPMNIEALGLESLHVVPTVGPGGLDVEVRWERGSYVDAVINLVGGIACVGFGFGLVLGWAQGKSWWPLLFGLMLIAIFRVRWSEIAQSVLRVAIVAALIASVFVFGEHAVIAGAFVAVGYGLFYAVRGWFAFRLFEHRKLGVAVPGIEPAPAEAIAAPAHAEPPAPSP